MLRKPTSSVAADSKKTANKQDCTKSPHVITAAQNVALQTNLEKSTCPKSTFDVKKYFPKDLTTKLKETKGPRIVQLCQYSTRRQELLEQNKPVATYERKIMAIWKVEDFKLQRDRLLARRLAHLRAPSVFKEQRVVKMSWHTQRLKSSMLPSHRQDRWWIVADTVALLHDMHFIYDLIISDKTCRIRMPYEVLHDLTAMTAKRNRAWVRMPARKLLSFIEKYEGYGKNLVAQGAVDAEDLLDHPFATDAVLNCCMQSMRLYYYVVLISDDPVRKERAKYIGMPCYTLQEVRDLVLPKYSNHLETKCQITVKVPSPPEVTTPIVPSQGYYFMPPPLYPPIGWPSSYIPTTPLIVHSSISSLDTYCIQPRPDLTSPSFHIRAASAGQTTNAPSGLTMADHCIIRDRNHIKI